MATNEGKAVVEAHMASKLAEEALGTRDFVKAKQFCEEAAASFSQAASMTSDEISIAALHRIADSYEKKAQDICRFSLERKPPVTKTKPSGLAQSSPDIWRDSNMRRWTGEHTKDVTMEPETFSLASSVRGVWYAGGTRLPVTDPEAIQPGRSARPYGPQSHSRGSGHRSSGGPDHSTSVPPPHGATVGLVPSFQHLWERCRNLTDALLHATNASPGQEDDAGHREHNPMLGSFCVVPGPESGTPRLKGPIPPEAFEKMNRTFSDLEARGSANPDEIKRMGMEVNRLFGLVNTLSQENAALAKEAAEGKTAANALKGVKKNLDKFRRQLAKEFQTEYETQSRRSMQGNSKGSLGPPSPHPSRSPRVEAPHDLSGEPGERGDKGGSAKSSTPSGAAEKRIRELEEALSQQSLKMKVQAAHLEKYKVQWNKLKDKAKIIHHDKKATAASGMTRKSIPEGSEDQQSDDPAPPTETGSVPGPIRRQEVIESPGKGEG